MILLCIHAWLVAFDQLVCVTLLSLLAPFGLAHVPSPYETISSLVGRRANAGQQWAVWTQRHIDCLFERLGSAPGHCQRSIIRVDWLSLPSV